MANEMQTRHSFILRIWRENSDHEWKYWIQHAGSGQSVRLVTLDELLSFVDQYKNSKPTQNHEGSKLR